MSCIMHEYKGKQIKFNGDKAWCLCCFPNNYWNMDGIFDGDQLKTMAYFTIAIRIIDEGEEGFFGKHDVIYLPDDLPVNMRQGVDRYFILNKGDI